MYNGMKVAQAGVAVAKGPDVVCTYLRTIRRWVHYSGQTNHGESKGEWGETSNIQLLRNMPPPPRKPSSKHTAGPCKDEH